MNSASLLSGEMIPIWLALVVTIMAFIFITNLAFVEGTQSRITRKATRLLNSCALSVDASSFEQVEAYFMKKKALLEKRPSLFKRFLECKERKFSRVARA